MSEKIKDKGSDKDADRERELDVGLDGTFPASDPPSATQPGDGGHKPDDAPPRKPKT